MAHDKSSQKKQKLSPAAEARTLPRNLPFTAAEAYKLLRTNLLFALPGEDAHPCRVIGVTSAIRGEGKTTTSINLASALAEVGKRVLLIEADMRLPTLAAKLGIRSNIGLSNLLATQISPSVAIRPSGYAQNWKIITAGELPPNPSELLASPRMHHVLSILSASSDFIILDLPPVNVVSDALVLSAQVDGYIVVVREGYTDRAELRACVCALKMASAKVLGFLLTGVKEDKKRYSKYRGRYRYKGYGYKTYARPASPPDAAPPAQPPDPPRAQMLE